MNSSRVSRVLAGAFAPFIAVSAIAAGAGASRIDCASLSALKLPDVTIRDAKVGEGNTPHCRVTGVIGSEIRFALLLPDAWNRKFAMGGGGGFVGSVQNMAQASLASGYATVGTDTGHQASGTTAAWALNNFERQINYGYLAVHRTAEVAKAVIRGYYGADATRSYFTGCSNGGRQALMEAQRFPNDFDGIVAGAPAYNITGISAQFIKDSQASFPNPDDLATSTLPPDTLKFVSEKILAACDAKDGVKDSTLDDPRLCKFDIASLPACAGEQAGPQCVTSAQRESLKKIYGETRAGDTVIFPGQPFGGEAETAGWQTWITGVNATLMTQQKAPSLRYAFGTEIFKYFVFADPSWDYSRYDLANSKRDTARIATYLNATDTNLDPFKRRGGKLLIWHGWADPALSALATVEYYEDVQARDASARDYARLFLLPGVLHCAGGPGPDTVDWVAAIDSWVESGKAPDQLIASKSGAVTRSRPLCPYPQRAVYSGKGSTDDAKNFACRDGAK
jgi:hypothetical protein